MPTSTKPETSILRRVTAAISATLVKALDLFLEHRGVTLATFGAMANARGGEDCAYARLRR